MDKYKEYIFPQDISVLELRVFSVSIATSFVYKPKKAGQKYITVVHVFVSDLSDSCEVVLMVRRGTTWGVAPRQSLTVSCPVKHCGESLRISWCKIFGITCETINSSENVEIRQIHTEDEEISQLIFKQVSTDDDGLYRCELMGQTSESVSHSINISVSGV